MRVVDPSTDVSASSDLADYGRVLRRQWWLIALGLIVGATLGYAAAATTSKTYEATTSVLVTPAQGLNNGAVAGGRTNSDINLDTEAQLVRSSVVADGARQLLRTSTPSADLLPNVSVSVPANTSVINISYSASTARGAMQGSEAFSEAYLANRTDTAKTNLSQEVGSLRGQITTLSKQLQTVTAQVVSLPSDSSQRSFAQAQQSLLSTQINDLNSQLSPLLTDRSTPGRIINSADLPSSPAKPSKLMYVVGGLLVGLLVGLALAIIRERADHRLRRPSDLELRLELPVLAYMQGLRRRMSTKGLMAPTHATGQAFRQLRNTLIAALDDPPCTVLVAGASAGDTTSVIAANLAATLARTGSTTTLICAASGSLAPRILDVKDGPGLAEALASDHTLASVSLSVDNLARLRVVGPGSADRLQDALPAGPISAILDQAKSQADYVVVEAPAVSLGADAQALASHCDAVLLVAEMGRTRQEQVIDAARQFDQVEAVVLGAVVAPRQRRSALPGRDSATHSEALNLAHGVTPSLETSGGKDLATSAAAEK